MYSYSILREPLLGYMCNTLNSSAENPKETQWQVGSAVEVTAILVSTYQRRDNVRSQSYISQYLSA